MYHMSLIHQNTIHYLFRFPRSRKKCSIIVAVNWNVHHMRVVVKHLLSSITMMNVLEKHDSRRVTRKHGVFKGKCKWLFDSRAVLWRCPGATGDKLLPLGYWKNLLFSYKLKCWAPRISWLGAFGFLVIFLRPQPSTQTKVLQLCQKWICTGLESDRLTDPSSTTPSHVLNCILCSDAISESSTKD